MKLDLDSYDFILYLHNLLFISTIDLLSGYKFFSVYSIERRIRWPSTIESEPFTVIRYKIFPTIHNIYTFIAKVDYFHWSPRILRYPEWKELLNRIFSILNNLTIRKDIDFFGKKTEIPCFSVPLNHKRRLLTLIWYKKFSSIFSPKRLEVRNKIVVYKEVLSDSELLPLYWSLSEPRSTLYHIRFPQNSEYSIVMLCRSA